MSYQVASKQNMSKDGNSINQTNFVHTDISLGDLMWDDDNLQCDTGQINELLKLNLWKLLLRQLGPTFLIFKNNLLKCKDILQLHNYFLHN